MRRPAVRLTQRLLTALALPLAVVAIAPAAASAYKRGDTLRVKATAYGGQQKTYTGATVRHGICAVDPKVIPLGKRFFVPGYGPCLAADIGPAVRGAFIDVWVSTERRANTWGVRYLTIRFL